MIFTFLDPSDDPNHPRNFTKWHRIPNWLHWLCIMFAAISWAFESSETEPETSAIIYDFSFFRLKETPEKVWFFKAL